MGFETATTRLHPHLTTPPHLLTSSPPHLLTSSPPHLTTPPHLLTSSPPHLTSPHLTLREKEKNKKDTKDFPMRRTHCGLWQKEWQRERGEGRGERGERGERQRMQKSQKKKKEGGEAYLSRPSILVNEFLLNWMDLGCILVFSSHSLVFSSSMVVDLSWRKPTVLCTTNEYKRNTKQK